MGFKVWGLGVPVWGVWDEFFRFLSCGDTSLMKV